MTVPGAGSGHVRWTAVGAGGTSTVVQAVTLDSEATLDGTQSVQVGDGFSGANVVIRSQGTVALGTDNTVGEVRANGAITQGDRTTIGVVEHRAGASSVPVPPTTFVGGPNVNLEPGRADDWRGQLRQRGGQVAGDADAAGGDVSLRAADLEPQAIVVLLGPSTTTMFVHTSLIWRGQTVTSSGASAPATVIYVGTSSVSPDLGFVGTLAAPNAEIDLPSSPRVIVGAFRGLRIVVGPHALLTSKPPGCN